MNRLRRHPLFLLAIALALPLGVGEIQQQWYQPNYWTDVQKQADEIDELIVEFNKEVGIS